MLFLFPSFFRSTTAVSLDSSVVVVVVVVAFLFPCAYLSFVGSFDRSFWCSLARSLMMMLMLKLVKSWGVVASHSVCPTCELCS